MDILLYILSAISLLVGVAGCFIPGLPGPPVAYLGVVLLHFTSGVQYPVSNLLLWAILVVVVQLLDYLTPLWGTKYSGGTNYGKWGCIIGTFVGVIFFPPWGILFGPFAGAVTGELLGGKDVSLAFKAGVGAFVGFIVSTLLKLVLCGYFIFLFIRSFF